MKKALIAICISLLGCDSSQEGYLAPEASVAALYGSIVIANQGTKTVSLLTKDGKWIKDLLRLDASSTDIPYGLALDNEGYVMVVVDGVDRVVRAPLISGHGNESSNFIINSLLNGNLRGITQLSGGDYLVVESNNLERFDTAGTRITTGGWPRALQTAGSGVAALPSGGFIQCSTGTDVVRAYTDAGVQTATASSGIAGTTDVIGCEVGPNGEVGVAFSGTTDTIRVYTNSTLSTVAYSYSNSSILSNPRDIAFTPEGNLLAVDGTSNLIVEIDPSGNFVRTITTAVLSTPTKIMVIR